MHKSVLSPATVLCLLMCMWKNAMCSPLHIHIYWEAQCSDIWNYSFSLHTAITGHFFWEFLYFMSCVGTAHHIGHNDLQQQLTHHLLLSKIDNLTVRDAGSYTYTSTTAHCFMKQRDNFGFPNQSTVKFYPYSLQPNYVVPISLYNDTVS